MTLFHLASQQGRGNKIYDAWLTSPVGIERTCGAL